MKLTLIHFFLAWWFKNIGVLLYIGACIWLGNSELEIGTSSIILFAVLTKEPYFKCGFLCTVLCHIIILCTVLFMYMYKSKKKIILTSCMLLSFIPNEYNPYNSYIVIKLSVYCFVVWRMKKSKGLPISKYICFSWFLFTHVCCLIFLPIQIVYDTYNYKIDFNV